MGLGIGSSESLLSPAPGTQSPASGRTVLNIPILLDRHCYRQPSFLVDAITEHDAGRRLVAVKNVTVNEEFFQGHFPGAPVLPGVMMLESLSQVAAMLLLHREDAPPNARVYLRGINDAKFRRQVFPGDQLRLEVTLGARRTSLAPRSRVATGRRSPYRPSPRSPTAPRCRSGTPS